MTFDYSELSDRAKVKAKLWLDDIGPFDYENDSGETEWDYPSDWDDDEINLYCKDNEFLFDKTGRAIHHLIEG